MSSFMNPLSVDISSVLEEAPAIGTAAATSGWAIWCGEDQDQPDTTIAIIDTGGPTPGRAADRSLNALEYPTAMIRVRANGYAQGYRKIQEVLARLEAKARFDVEVDSMTTVRYSGIFKQTEILHLGRDEGRRHLFSANVRAVRKVK